MPQIDIQTFPSQIFWLLVTFGVVLSFVCLWFSPRLIRVLDLRRAKLDETYEHIQKVRTETDTLKKECQAILMTARQEMASLIDETEEKAEREQRKLQESLTLEIKEKLSQWESDFRKDQKETQNDVLEKIGSMVALCAQQMKDMTYEDRVSAFLEEIAQSNSKVRH